MTELKKTLLTDSELKVITGGTTKADLIKYAAAVVGFLFGDKYSHDSIETFASRNISEAQLGLFLADRRAILDRTDIPHTQKDKKIHTLTQQHCNSAYNFLRVQQFYNVGAAATSLSAGGICAGIVYHVAGKICEAFNIK